MTVFNLLSSDVESRLLSSITREQARDHEEQYSLPRPLEHRGDSVFMELYDERGQLRMMEDEFCFIGQSLPNSVCPPNPTKPSTARFANESQQSQSNLCTSLVRGRRGSSVATQAFCRSVAEPALAETRRAPSTQRQLGTSNSCRGGNPSVHATPTTQSPEVQQRVVYLGEEFICRLNAMSAVFAVREAASYARNGKFPLTSTSGRPTLQERFCSIE